MAVNTKMPLTNTADGYLCEGTDIRGGYFTIDLKANIPATIAKNGSLCYCTADSKFYQYNGTEWVETLKEAPILNIENGTGTDSIVMKYSGEIDDTHYGNTCTGESAAVFGEGNNNTANRALLVGKLNTNSGVNSIQGGHGNHNEHNNVIQSGWECINKGTYSIQNGWICENSGAYAIQNGYKNNNSAIYSTQNGEGNVNSGLGSAQFGQYNTNTGNNVIQCGLYNNNSTDGAIVGGVYSKNTPNALLKIGNGTGKDDEYRRNAFEVLKDGRAKVLTAPIDDNDVVRKAELDKKVTVSDINQDFFNSLYQ